MIEIKDKSKCSGCHACYSICPKQCISMLTDKEGFWYPKIDKNKCIKCNLCEKICPIIYKIEIKNEPNAYAAYNKDNEIREQSSSGGIFTLLANQVINRGGAVVGACFDEEFNVVHKLIENEEELSKIRGAKYVQSKINDIYKIVKLHLEIGRIILFTGTPCQIAGLKSYLRKEYDNLICQDIICHGVPSPKVWEKYRNNIAPKDMLQNIEFRNKRNGWRRYSVVFKFNDNSEYCELSEKNNYIKGFIKDIYLRPSCYDCSDKSIHRKSDITLADFWGIENILPDMDDNKGTSLLFINTNKGKDILDSIKNEIIYKEVDINEAIKYNPSAIKSVKRPPNRDEFMVKLEDWSFTKLMNKYCEDSIFIKCKLFIYRVLSKIKRIILR